MDPNFWFGLTMVIFSQFSSSDYIRIFSTEQEMVSSLRVVNYGYAIPVRIVGKPEQIEVPNWKAFYLLKVKHGIITRDEVRYDYPTATQVVEINARVSKENPGIYQFYGDQENEKWHPDETTTSAQIAQSIQDNIYGTETGVKPGMEDWSQPDKKKNAII